MIASRLTQDPRFATAWLSTNGLPASYTIIVVWLLVSNNFYFPQYLQRIDWLTGIFFIGAVQPPTSIIGDNKQQSNRIFCDWSWFSSCQEVVNTMGLSMVNHGEDELIGIRSLQLRSTHWVQLVVGGFRDFVAPLVPLLGALVTIGWWGVSRSIPWNGGPGAAPRSGDVAQMVVVVIMFDHDHYYFVHGHDGFTVVNNRQLI